MKRLTWKTEIYASVDVPDDCPDDPNEAADYCHENGYTVKYDFSNADTDSIVCIDVFDTIDGAEEYVKTVYER